MLKQLNNLIAFNLTFEKKKYYSNGNQLKTWKF